ncbi:MAG: Crp/Fnr family transcriptional regulator [Planctomycetota bacterium]|jgi:CRP-like cAMP-binding protein
MSNNLKATWSPGEDKYPRMHWELGEDAHEAFARFGVVHELTAREPIFEEGKASDALYLVLDGEVAIVKGNQVITTIGANHSFGELGLLLGRKRSAGAAAVTDARVLELSIGDLDRMQEEDPAWAARLYRVLAECVAEYLAQAISD